MAREAGERWACECGEQLVGARTKNGKVAPITMAPYEDGNVLLFRAADGGLASAVAGAPIRDWAREQGVPLRRNHFYGCPDRERFQRGAGR